MTDAKEDSELIVLTPQQLGMILSAELKLEEVVADLFKQQKQDSRKIGKLAVQASEYKKTISEYKKRLKQAEKLITHDSLTVMYNRRYFDTKLESEISRAVRYNHHLSLIMGDLDHFKDTNDNFGHLGGDNVLKAVGQTLVNAAREIDTVARYGGEEIAIVLPETDYGTAIKVAERYRGLIERLNVQHTGQQIPVTMSLGVSTYVGHGTVTMDELIGNADTALYKAKINGRNRVESALE